MGVSVVTGFTGSPIWHMVYPFPPVSEDDIKAGFKKFADVWGPILDVFQECGVKFALEVHPCEIAFDLYSAEMALDFGAETAGEGWGSRSDSRSSTPELAWGSRFSPLIRPLHSSMRPRG